MFKYSNHKPINIWRLCTWGGDNWIYSRHEWSIIAWAHGCYISLCGNSYYVWVQWLLQIGKNNILLSWLASFWLESVSKCYHINFNSCSLIKLSIYMYNYVHAMCHPPACQMLILFGVLFILSDHSSFNTQAVHDLARQ